MLGSLPPGLTTPLLAGAPTVTMTVGRSPMGIAGGGNLIFGSAVAIGLATVLFGGFNLAGGALLKALVAFGVVVAMDNILRYAFPVIIAVGL